MDASNIAVCIVRHFSLSALLSDPEEIERRSSDGVEQGGTSERPEEILLTDLPILINVVCWVLTIFVILWLKHQSLIQ